MGEHSDNQDPAQSVGQTAAGDPRCDLAVTRHDDLWWPSTDRIARDVILGGIDFLNDAVAVCGTRRVAIQAGGNVGAYPVALSSLFDHVVTFEPESLNFHCLGLNTEDRDNITSYRAALGPARGAVSLDGWDPNCGAYRVVGKGDIPMVRIDDLQLDGVDFIQLDVEGFELPALEGAVRTLMRHRPVVMVEDLGHGPSCASFLDDLGYQMVMENDTDKVYINEGMK